MTASRVSAALYGLVGLALALLGLRYLLAAQLMPYHLAVLGAPWAGLEAAEQRLYLGLLRGFGAGALCVGLATLGLALWRLRAGSTGADRLLAALALGYTALLVYATRSALLPGARPVAASLALFGLAAAAAIGVLVAGRRSGASP